MFLGSYDDAKKRFFSKFTKFVNVCARIAQKHHVEFFLTYPIRKSKIFYTIKCVLRTGTCPLRDKKNALKQPHTFVELRRCNIYLLLKLFRHQNVL